MIISLSLIGMQQDAHAQTVEQPPTFTVSFMPNITIMPTGAQTDIRPHLIPPVAIDSDGRPLTPTHNAESSYSLGAYIITWTATDGKGLSVNMDQTFIITSSVVIPTFTVSSLPDLIILTNTTQTDIRPHLIPPMGGEITPLHNALESYPLGNFTILWTAVSSSGGSSVLPQIVIVTPESGLTQERLVALIEVRNLALEQQNYQIDYWSDPTNPFADDRVMAQDRIDNANYHISITTPQRDFHQTELDQLTG